MKRLFLICICLLALSACTTAPTITTAGANPAAVVAHDIAPAGSTVATDLQDAASNLDQAIAIGVLPQGDAADGCVHSALQLAGLEPIPGAPAVQSFVPKIAGAISAGSVLYIQEQQAAGAQPFTVSTPCKAIVGDIVLKGLAVGGGAALAATPGASALLNVIKIH